MKTQTRNRRSKERQKYQRSLTIKPTIKREFLHTLPYFLIVLLLLNLFLTEIAANDYMNFAKNYVSSIISTNNQQAATNIVSYGSDIDGILSLDYRNMKKLDQHVYADTGNEDLNHNLNMALSITAFRALIPYFDNSNSILMELYHLYNSYTKGYAYDSLYSAVCNTFYNENGLLIDSTSKIFQPISYNNKSAGLNFYMLDYPAIDAAYPGLYQHIIDLSSNDVNELSYVTLEYDTFYIKGGYFLPKQLQLTKKTERINGINYESPQVLEILDLSKCDFTGYTLFETTSDMQIFSPIILFGAPENSPQLVRYNNIDLNELQQILDQMLNSDLGYDNHSILQKYLYKGYIANRMANGTLANIVAFDFDFYRDWESFLFIIYAVTTFVFAILLLIVAKLRYNKKLLSYEIDNYRRKTTSAMAHDLKSPLMAISGYAENIVQCSDASKKDEYAKKIVDLVGNMDHMIINILELSKVENGELSIHKTEIQLEKLIEKQLANFKNQLEAKSMTVQTTGFATIYCDETWMAHLIDNLLSNAVKYGTESSTININISKKSLSIRNTYSNVIEKDATELLNPFTKGDTARNNTSGNGLGLNIVKGIADTFGFSVEVKIDKEIFEVNIGF